MDNVSRVPIGVLLRMEIFPPWCMRKTGSESSTIPICLGRVDCMVTLCLAKRAESNVSIECFCYVRVLISKLAGQNCFSSFACEAPLNALPLFFIAQRGHQK